MTSELIGQVAEAISEARTGNSLSWRHYVAEAKAAIAAMQADAAEQAAEVERLKKLIEATSAHFLRLNTDHPIMWEGAIDAAMEAVCLEVERQAAELAKFKALAETLAGALHHRGGPLCPARYYGDAQCTCGVAEALREYKEARDAS